MLLRLFCSIHVFSGLDGALPHEEGPFALLSLTTQILISSRNSFTDIFRIMFNQLICPKYIFENEKKIWALNGLVRLTHKLSFIISLTNYSSTYLI